MDAQKILVVEDDEVVRTGLQNVLDSEGYSAVPAPTIGEAITKIKFQRPNLIILDLTVMDSDPFGTLNDGFSLLHMLRRDYSSSELPVIIYTADHSPEVDVQAQQLGVSAVIHKGTPPDMLLDIIHQILEEPQSSAAAY